MRKKRTSLVGDITKSPQPDERVLRGACEQSVTIGIDTEIEATDPVFVSFQGTHVHELTRRDSGYCKDDNDENYLLGHLAKRKESDVMCDTSDGEED